MEPIESSETSAYINTLTPGTYPKEKKLLLLLFFRSFLPLAPVCWKPPSYLTLYSVGSHGGEWITNWGRCGWKQSWSDLRHYRDSHIGMLEKISKKLKKGSRRLGQDLNLGPPEYKTGMGLLPTGYEQQEFHLVMLHNPAEQNFLSQVYSC